MVARLKGLGATSVDVGQGGVPWTVLADPEGNEFRVLEPRSIYRDTGPIAAVVVDCADPRAMARFWNEAMDWTLHEVTDDHARLRSAAGVGPYLEFLRAPDVTTVRTRVHLDLRPYPGDDQAAEVARLRDLGATDADIGQGDVPWWSSPTQKATSSASSPRADAEPRRMVFFRQSVWDDAAVTDHPERRMLLDTAALYFRAFHGVPDSVHAPNGMSVNAVRGLLDIIARLVSEFRPSEIVACWDDDWRPQWRVDLIPTYKTHRLAVGQPADAAHPIEQVPELLTPQVPVIRAVLGALGIPVVGAPNHEADDVIGTLASNSAIPVDVVTGDRDLFQLVDDSRDVRVIYTGRGMSHLEILTDAALVAKYGVTPAQYADFAAMRGDASDGLPGVAGVGEKTAVALLDTYGDLDGIVSAAADTASGMAPPVRARILAAADYLAVAPAVVKVVRDLELPEFDARIRVSTREQAAELDRLSADWGLGSSLNRAREALAALAVE